MHACRSTLEDPTSTRLTSLTKAYASAASAGKAYFQALVGLDDASSASFAFSEPAWATAAWGTDLAATYATRPGDVDHVIALAAGSQAYLSSSSLQNKYYALAYKDGVVARPAALAAQLAAAREAALAALVEVQASVPPRITLEFNRAEQLATGSDDDKIDALGAWWRTTFAAALLAELGRVQTTTTSLPTIAIPPQDLEPVVKKGVKPQKKLPIRKPPPKKPLKKK